MIGDGEDDLEHGTFGHEDESDMVLVSPEIDDWDMDDFDREDNEYEDRMPHRFDDELVFNIGDKIFDDEDDIDDEQVEGLFTVTVGIKVVEQTTGPTFAEIAFASFVKPTVLDKAACCTFLFPSS
jgi:hypothetical protein